MAMDGSSSSDNPKGMGLSLSVSLSRFMFKIVLNQLVPDSPSNLHLDDPKNYQWYQSQVLGVDLVGVAAIRRR
jgi:hypothetical protein